MYTGWVNIVRHAQITLEYEPSGVDSSSGAAPKAAYLPFELNAPLYRRQLDASSSEIRVLVVEPGYFRDPIAARLTYQRLGDEQAVQFDALTYSWGYPKDLRSITLLGSKETAGGKSRIHITPSAESAVRRLRHPSQVTHLWIDAVCICQSDPVEKSEQVSMMTRIFSSARTVHVWLGEHEGIEAALRIIRDAHNCCYLVCS